MQDDDSNAVAIIGMTGRFAEAHDLATFWKNIRDGVESVRPITDEELLANGEDEATINDRNYVKVASMLEGIDMFDAHFFGFSPREAEIMDPQHRLFLECAFEAIEHAGYAADTYPGAIGIYAGTALSNYMVQNLMGNRQLLEQVGDRQMLMVNEKDFLCGRVAYELNLKGPAVVVQSACSTSLVAVHMACQSVLNGECDMALAGGVSIQALEKRGYLYAEGGLLSVDGHCRAFDAGATGIVTGNGLGVVVLKTLANARADGDTIHAVIRGSAINNDGRDKASFSAPSADGQAAVIGEAQAMAGVDAGTITYVEAHGTGTMLGDPIEMSALKQAFGASTDKRRFCAVGSLKTNLGHLDVAAGVAGLMKTVMALKHREIPPSLHFVKPNPHIDFADSAFFVADKLSPWESPDAPRRAGVSSFGIGGTNAHVVLEEAPEPDAPDASRSSQLLVLSAKTQTALATAASNLAAFLAANPDVELADVANTLQRGRQPFSLRRSVVCDSVASAIDMLQAPAPRAIACSDTMTPEVVFMFPGGGTQYIGMGRSLYESEELFRGVVDECAQLLIPTLGMDLRDVMFGDDAALLDKTMLALPALFTLEYALTKQYQAWGIKPAAMIGHSLGEYVAACVAGVFSLRDALVIVTERGRLISSLPTGNMLAILLSADDIKPRLADGLWLACVNAGEACTVSGTPEATERMAAQLEADGVEFQLLKGWPGSHSGLMEPILEQFRATFEGVTLNAPQLPYMSNLSGDWVTAEQATDPAYWVAHLHNTVQFAPCLRQLLKNPAHVYLEVGPGHTLANLLKREAASAKPVTSIPRRDVAGCSLASVLQALGQLWTGGVAIDWDAFYGAETRRRIPLPTYPFERKRFWIEPARKGGASVAHAPESVPVEEEFAHHDRPALPTAYVEAQSDTERTLCGIWSNLLGVAPIGVNDNFFLMGGSSLVAIQLAARIRGAFRVELPLRTLFDTPTVAAQAAEIANKQGAPMGAPIVPREPGIAAPLSYAQQRLWFVDQLDHTASVAFHIPAALRLTGQLDRAALKATLDRIVARHESLRTTFGENVQVIAAPDCGFTLRERDLSDLAGHEQQFTVAQISTDEGVQPFDLVAGPLIRGQLLRLSESEHILLITQHHIISDGWSLGVLVQEVSALYTAFAQGQGDPLPPLAVQYADYAAWQRDMLQGELSRVQTQFWTDWLSGAPALLTLPTDRPRPAQQSYAGSTVPVTFGPELTAGLKALGQRHGTTLFMTLLAGWSALLARMSGQQDVVIGTPVANRQRTEVESLIGFFVNTLALRVKIDADPTVAGLLAQVKADTLRAYEHQDISFDHVVEAVKPARSMSYTPLFQVMLNMHNTPSYRELAMHGLKLDSIEQVQLTSQYDMMLSLTDVGHEIGGEIRFASALFDNATVARLADSLQLMLAAMVADDQQQVSRINLLGDADRKRLLADFNNTKVALPVRHLAHQLFEEQVASHPDATALVFEETTLTYTELNKRANRLAHRLIGMGVKPEQRVAICVERGIEMVVGMLGILKAGGAYVPMDPGYPAERLEYMRADSAPVAVLTSQEITDAAGGPESNPDLALSGTGLAYVIYTSGSTGQPKGVMNTHASLCNLACAQIAAFEVMPDSRVLQFASFSFDASISEMAMALCSGAALVLAKREALWPGEPLQETLSRHKVTHVTLPSSALAVYPDNTAFEPMTLIVAGDACPPALARHWSQRHTLFNAYGPTEAAVCATIYRCNCEREGAVPIGRPIDNVQIYVLDQHLALAPLGAIGEICIGGAGVARGYMNMPELSAERFVADPFGGQRLYRTGDLGRWLADGNLEFLGRNDFQVKVRGFRIELGEVEAKLAACEGVLSCAVVAREERLVGYVVGSGLTTEGLRAALSASLAEYMLPAAFVMLDALPLTSNGKLDRAALPAPEMQVREYQAPQGDTETALSLIWQELLGLERAGRHDPFFELGGHSLMAVQLVARVKDALGVTIALSDVFQHPTVAALADVVIDAQLSQFDSADIDLAALDIEAMSDDEVERLLAR